MIAAAKRLDRRRRRRVDRRQLELAFAPLTQAQQERVKRFERKLANPPRATGGPELLGDILARVLAGRL